MTDGHTVKRRRQDVFPHGLCGQFYISVAQQALRVRRCFGQVPLFATLWTVARWAPLSMGFSVQEYWRGLSCSSAGDLPDPGTTPAYLMPPALAGRSFTTSATWEARLSL